MISKDRNSEFHIKGWGYEIWMANSELYCGKLLVVNRGLKCSVHYHKLKDETFYIQSGRIIMSVWEEPFDLDELAGDVSSEAPAQEDFVMEPGDRLVIQPNIPHQFIGLDAQSTIIEISTQHFEDDSYRILKGD